MTGTTESMTKASFALMIKIKASPIISVNIPRRNSARVKEIASCICERSEDILLLNSPTLFSVKKLIGILNNLL